MTRKVAGRWVDGQLTERLVDCGPGAAKPGHGRPTLAIYTDRPEPGRATFQSKTVVGRMSVRMAAQS